MKFAYVSHDHAGRESRGTIDAPGVAEAMDQLRRRGLFASSIQPAGGGEGAAAGAPERRGIGAFLRGGRRLKTVAVFTRQLGVLVSTGTPVVEALAALERQSTQPAWSAALARVRARVEEGHSLSEAMRAEPAWFDPVCWSLVAAGESGGRLDAMLQRLAALNRQQVQIRGAVVGAMVYPSLLIGVSVSVLVLMIVFVLPRFAGLFDTLGAPLPPTTELLMKVSAFLHAYWWAVLGGLAVLGVCAGAWARSSPGRALSARWLTFAPQVGRIVRSFASARLARVLGVLVDSRVPLIEALALTRQTMKNPLYVALIEQAEAGVTRGEAISAALVGSPLVTASLGEAVRNAERSGQVGAVLLQIADYLDEDNDVMVRSLTSLLEPVILIALGLVVGFVAMSMFMPLFDLAASAQQGGPQ